MFAGGHRRKLPLSSAVSTPYLEISALPESRRVPMWKEKGGGGGQRKQAVSNARMKTGLRIFLQGRASPELDLRLHPVSHFKLD